MSRLKANFLGGKLDFALPATDTTVTDAVLTNASPAITSATAAFSGADTGAPLTGNANIPANTYVLSEASGTAATMSANATGSASAQTVNILRSQAMQSAALANAPVVASPDVLPIILDPDGIFGAPEVVWVTMHLSGQPWAQVSRAQEGTAARVHNQDEDWVHAPTIYDFLASQGAVIATSETTTSLTYADLATVGPAVTIDVGPTGLAIVHLSALSSVTTAGPLTYMGVALSGANTLAAADGNAAVISGGTNPVGVSRTVVLTGLTPGATTFTAKYKTSNNSFTMTFTNRGLAVITF